MWLNFLKTTRHKIDDFGLMTIYNHIYSMDLRCLTLDTFGFSCVIQIFALSHNISQCVACVI